MPNISKKEVERIARLARLVVTDDEAETYGNELSAILAFVGQLNEVDTNGFKPMTGGTLLESIERPDEVTDSSLEGRADALIEAFPERQGRRTKVKAIFP